ncbi:MAG: hypothetical protein JWN04_105 [Myxococcaceae bacterium]|nr:hypothetical protein [Myxococcaceae bacterium]
MAKGDDFTWADVIAELERAFAERKMRGHLELLAKFKARYDVQRRRLSGMSRPPWTTENLVGLAASFQIAPFADLYPVAPRDNRCPFCRADLSAREVATVRAVYPDRTLHACKHCHGRWLVLK